MAPRQNFSGGCPQRDIPIDWQGCLRSVMTMRPHSVIPLEVLKILGSSCVLVILCIGSFADDLKDIAVAKKKYERSEASGGEAVRVAYVGKLANILGDLIDERMWTGKTRHPEYFDLLYAELKRHPAPKDSDSQMLSRLRVGTWESPRHDYQYRSDGTWCMLPDEPGITSGHWRIEGNEYFDGTGNTLGVKDRYTIILLTDEKFVFTDGAHVFYEGRIEDHSGE